MVQSRFRVIPVLDIKDGQAVHAVGGIRSHYRPVRSLLHPSSDPQELARAYRDQFGLRELYIADLDAIAGRPPNRPLYTTLAEQGWCLWIDAGLKNEVDLEALVEFTTAKIVVGLETVAGPDALSAMLKRAGSDRVIFSVDLFEGRPRRPAVADWESADADGISKQVLKLGVQRLLILDLARVGTGQGIGTEELLRQLHDTAPAVEFSVGGGISGIDEIAALQRAGAASVLLGSALHDGRIGRSQLDQLRRHSTSAD